MLGQVTCRLGAHLWDSQRIKKAVQTYFLGALNRLDEVLRRELCEPLETQKALLLESEQVRDAAHQAGFQQVLDGALAESVDIESVS